MDNKTKNPSRLYSVWTGTFWFFIRREWREVVNEFELTSNIDKVLGFIPAKFQSNPSKGSKDNDKNMGGSIQFVRTLALYYIV